MRIIVSKTPSRTSASSNDPEVTPSTSADHAPAAEPSKAETVTSLQDAQASAPKKLKKRAVDASNNNDEGYNSSDEYYGLHPSSPPSSQQQQKQHKQQLQQQQQLSQHQLASSEVDDFHQFTEALRQAHGFYIKRMLPDGNCLFRSISDQVYGDQEMHDQFVTEDFNEYIARKRQDRCYGNNLEIQAISELYNRPVEIYTFQGGRLKPPVNIFHGQYATDNAPIRLSYHHGNHYNSVFNPNNPSVGVGLGLPDFEPGLADKMQMRSAIQQSEHDELDHILVDKLKQDSELELAEKEMEAAILAQSQQELEQAILAESRREYFENLYKTLGNANNNAKQ